MLLSWIVFLPAVFAVLLACLPSKSYSIVRSATFGFTLIEFVLSLAILKDFNTSTPHLQFVEKIPWIESFGISYFLGVDGISLWLIILTTFLTPIIVLASWKAINEKVAGFHISLLVLETALLGTFVAMDAVLFYVFWELTLVPMYFIVGIWGGARRIYATIKFFIYTMAGSVLMLIAIIYLMMLTKNQIGATTANVLDFYRLTIPQTPLIIGKFFGWHIYTNPQTLAFFAFAIAFAIKVPVFPFHTWLPDAHVEAPTPGSVILAGVMLKMGAYGFLRFALPIFPQAVQQWAWLFLVVGTIGVIYGALVAMVQPDIKKLVAYSSVSHMGYILIGMFVLNSYGVTGAIYQMLNHGISTGALFLLVGMIYERTHTREIKQYGGLAAVLPIYTIFFFIITLSSIAVPMTNGFVGEFLILLSTFESHKMVTYFAVTGVVFGAAYMLWMFKKVFFGESSALVKGDGHHPLHDLDLREFFVLVPMVIMVFWMGLMPNHFLSWTKASVDYLIQNKANYHLSVVEPSGEPSLVSPQDKPEDVAANKENHAVNQEVNRGVNQ